jgi:hypothetical protein
MLHAVEDTARAEALIGALRGSIGRNEDEL